MKRVLLSEKGFNYVTLILVLLLAGVIFSGATIAPKYITNYRLKQEVHKAMVECTSMVKEERITIKKANEKLNAFVKEKNIPLDVEKMGVCRMQGRDVILCEFDYQWPVVAFGQELFTLSFQHKETRKYSETSI